MSTGMASLSEIETAVSTARSEGNDQIILLKCTSTYPANPVDTNLMTIEHLRESFGTQVGLSDHTMGVGVSCAAVAKGATLIEKHFTLSRDEGGVDAAFSLEPKELKSLVEETQRAWQAMGTIKYGGSENEKSSLKYRRSIYVAEDILEGELFTEKNIRVVRPGYGLAPVYIDIFLGRRSKKYLKKGDALSWSHIG
jgi:N-acetylneuraminate synthase